MAAAVNEKRPKQYGLYSLEYTEAKKECQRLKQLESVYDQASKALQTYRLQSTKQVSDDQIQTAENSIIAPYASFKNMQKQFEDPNVLSKLEKTKRFFEGDKPAACVDSGENEKIALRAREIGQWIGEIKALSQKVSLIAKPLSDWSKNEMKRVHTGRSLTTWQWGFFSGSVVEDRYDLEKKTANFGVPQSKADPAPTLTGYASAVGRKA